MSDPAAEAILDAADKGVLCRRITGTVTDASTWPPLIDCGGGAVATDVAGPYVPIDNDAVICIEDWDGRKTGTRICIGPLMRAGGVSLSKATGTPQAAATTFTTVPWDTEIVDQGDWWSSGTTLTVPDGPTRRYVIHSVAAGTGNWPAGSAIQIMHNGTQRGHYETASAQNLIDAEIAGFRLAATDTITVRVFNNGTARNYTVTIDITPIG